MSKHQPKFGAVILAAGKASRFQENKLLARLGDSTVIEQTLETFLALKEKISSIVIVIGAYRMEMEKFLRNYDLEIIYNPDFAKKGMSSSVITGLKHLKQISKIEGVFIHPGDMPFINSDDLEKMILAFVNSSKKIIIPSFQKRRGHPLLVSRQLIDELSSIEDSKNGMRGFLEEFDKNIEYVLVDHAGILRDIDFPQDLQLD